jgi:hemophore-related protein
MGLKTKFVASVGGAALALMASAAIASADPTIEAVVNTTCTYPQVMAALNDQNPAAAAELNSMPLVTGWIGQLLASPPDARRAMIAQVQGYPQVQEYSGLIASVMGSCNNY